MSDSVAMPPTVRLQITATVLLGFFLRIPALFANTFHADEALFASWARLIAVWRDPLLLTQAIDKPPLLFYLQAIFYPLFGPVAWAARLPNFAASILLIPVVGLLAWRLYGDGLTAVVAALLLSLTPLAIQFSATAFTDPLLTFWITLSLVLSIRWVPANPGRESAGFHPLAAGLFLGLAAATKFQAWLFLPLVIGMAWLGGWRGRDWARWGVGLVTVLSLLAVWQLVRTSAESTGSLEAIGLLQLANIGGLRPIWSWELMPRLASWAQLTGLSLGWPLALLTTGLAMAGVLRLFRGPHSLLTSVDILLMIFAGGYLGLHWLVAVPVWDRYLLPLLPWVLVLVGRGLVALAGRVQRALPSSLLPRWGSAVLAIVAMLLLILLPGAIQARQGKVPLGGQIAADNGAAAMAQLLLDAPYGTVLYDHWYSWQWRYHLFDTGTYVSWFPHAASLMDDLAVFGNEEGDRYIALPDSAMAAPVRRELFAEGYDLVLVGGPAPGSVGLYEIVRQPDGETQP